jgi:hypothetical protein
MGSGRAAKWLRERGSASSISPDRLSFILLAYPENKFTGVRVVAPHLLGGESTDGIIGLPADTPYRVMVCTRQYDGLADYPNAQGSAPRVTSATAEENATQGMRGVHNNYFRIGVGDFRYTHVEGNITYAWSLTFPVPKVNKPAPGQRLWTPRDHPEYIAADQAIRPIIESQYARPAAIPNPD